MAGLQETDGSALTNERHPLRRMPNRTVADIECAMPSTALLGVAIAPHRHSQLGNRDADGGCLDLIEKGADRNGPSNAARGALDAAPDG